MSKPIANTETAALAPQPAPEAPKARLVEKDQVCADLGGLSNTGLYNLINRGEFPKPLKLGHRSFWLETDVADFIAGRAANRGVSPTRRRNVKRVG